MTTSTPPPPTRRRRRLPFSPFHLLLAPLALLFVMPLLQMVMAVLEERRRDPPLPAHMVSQAQHWPATPGCSQSPRCFGGSSRQLAPIPGSRLDCTSRHPF